MRSLVGVQAVLFGDRSQREIGGSAKAADGDAFAFEIAHGFHISLDGEKVIGTAEQDATVLTGKPALAAFIVEVLGVRIPRCEIVSALTAILVRIVIVKLQIFVAEEAFARRDLKRQGAEPAPVEAICISSAA
jgi:hypothetical protein